MSNTETSKRHITSDMISDAYREVFKLRSQLSKAQTFFQGTVLEALFREAMAYTWAIRTDLEAADIELKMAEEAARNKVA